MFWLSCCSCGCGLPDADHGSLSNIVAADLRRAARSAKISMKEAAANIVKTVAQLPDADEVQKPRGQ